MAAVCPNKSHSDWKYAVNKIGPDRTLYMYDMLGQHIPTKEEVDSIIVEYETQLKLEEDYNEFLRSLKDPLSYIPGEIIFYTEEGVRAYLNKAATSGLNEMGGAASEYRYRQQLASAADYALNSSLHLGSIVEQTHGKSDPFDTTPNKTSLYIITDTHLGDVLRGEDTLHFYEDGLEIPAGPQAYTLTPIKIEDDGKIYFDMHDPDTNPDGDTPIFEVPAFRFQQRGLKLVGELTQTKTTSTSELPVASKQKPHSVNQVISDIYNSKSITDVENALLGYKGSIGSKRYDGKLWVKALYPESPIDYIGVTNDLIDQIDAIYPGLVYLDYKTNASLKAGRGIYEVVVSATAWEKYFGENKDRLYEQGLLFKRNPKKETKDLTSADWEKIKSFQALAGTVTDPIQYISMIDVWFEDLSQEHRFLIDFFKKNEVILPKMTIEQIKRKELNKYFKSQEEADKFTTDLGFIRGNKIYIIKDNFKDESISSFVGTALHEIVHGITLGVLYKKDRGEQLTESETKFYNSVNDIYKKAKAKTRFKKHNAYKKGLKEFVADGITDQLIVTELQAMSEPDEKMSFWEQIKKFILEFLGLNYSKNSYHHQLLSAIMDYTYSVRTPLTGLEKVQASKIKDNIYINKDNPTHKEIVDTLSIHEEAYIARGEKWFGITNLMTQKRLGRAPKELLDEDTQAEVEKAGNLGSITHYVIQKSFSAAVKDLDAKNKWNLTPEAESRLISFFEKFKKPGVTILSEVFVSDVDNKMVGIIDLVIIDANNKVHIFDFKTKKGGFEHFDRTYFPKKGQPAFNPYSSHKQASLQLTAYKNMWEKVTKTDVETMSVIPLKPIIDEKTDTVLNYELDRSFNGKDIIPLEVNRNVTLFYLEELKAMNPEDNQDVYTSAESEDLIKEAAIRWRNKIEKLETASPEQELLFKAERALIQRMEATRKTDKQKKFQDQLNYLTKLLAIDDVQQALYHIVEVAHKITEDASNDLKKMKQQGNKLTPGILFRFKEAVTTFDILDELEPLLTNKYGLTVSDELKQSNPKFAKQLADMRTKLSETIRLKNAVKFDFEHIGLELMVDYIYPFYTKVRSEYREKYKKEYDELKKEDKLPNKDLTREDYVNNKLNLESENIDKLSKTMLRKEIKKAARDISFLSGWLDTILSTPDAPTGALVKALVMYDDISRIEIEDERLKVLPIVNLFKENTAKYGKNYMKAYEWMLELDEKGIPTGYLLSKFSSGLTKEYYATVALANAVLTDPDEQKFKENYISDWKKENMPLDHKRWRGAYVQYVDQLEKDGEITETERNQIVYEVTKASGHFIKLEKIIGLSSETVDKVSLWLQRNTWKFREPAEKWVDPRWAKLEEILKDPDDWRTKVYNTVIDLQERGDDMLPFGVKLNKRLPGVVKQKNERFGEGHSLMDIAKSSISKTLTFQVDDTHRVQTELQNADGSTKMLVPAHFTGRPTKTIKDPQDPKKEYQVFDPHEQSFDLLNIYFNFWAAANEFQWKNNIVPEMEMYKYLLKNRDITKRNSKGIKYVASRLIGKDKSELDEALIKGGNIAEQFEIFLNFALYGQLEKDLGVIPGTNIDAGKFVNFLGRFTSLNLLGLNFVASVSNVVLGNTMQAIEAYANQHIGPSEYAKGTMFYWKNLPGILGDIGSLKPTNIVSLLLREFNILHDPSVRNLTDSRWADLLTADSLFFTNHVGEHQMQSKFMLGMLEKARAYNEKGEDIGSMLDAYIRGEKEYIKGLIKEFGDSWDKHYEPKLRLPEDVSIEKSKWSKEQRSLFGYKVRALLSDLHGEYSALGRVAIQQNAILGLAYMFRKFVIPGARRRFGHRRYEERSEDFKEGNYVTTGVFIGQLAKNLKETKSLAMSKEWDKLDDLQKANIHRSVGEVVALIIASILVAISVRLRSDDDKEGDLFWNFVAYQALRLRSELLFFISPPQAMKILRSPAASISVIENTLKLVEQVFGSGWDRYEQGPFKDHLKIEKTLIDMSIGVKQYYRVKNIGEQVDLWKI